MGSCKYTEESLKLEHVPQGYGRKDKLARNEGEQGKFAWEHRLVSCLLSGKLNASTTGAVFVRRGFFLNEEGEGRQRVKGSPTPCFHPHSPSPPPSLFTPFYVCYPGHFLFESCDLPKSAGKVLESERTRFAWVHWWSWWVTRGEKWRKTTDFATCVGNTWEKCLE